MSNLGEYALVAKVDVTNLAESVLWYEEKLGLVSDPTFNTATWAQLALPGSQNAFVGLSQGSNTGSGGEATTFVVQNIEAARAALLNSGVNVGPIEQPGDGVSLAFFEDPSGNKLGLRQNG